MIDLDELNEKLGILRPPLAQWIEREYPKVELHESVNGLAIDDADALMILEERQAAVQEARDRRRRYDVYVASKRREHAQELAEQRAKNREARLKAAEKSDAARRRDLEAARKETAKRHEEEQKARRAGALPFSQWLSKAGKS
jgi:hypothetical protein